MGKHDKISVGTPDSQEIWLACSTCKNETRHKALTCVVESGESPDNDIQWHNTYQVVACQGCNTLSFLQEDSNNHDMDMDYDPESKGYVSIPNITRKVYPNRIAGRAIMADVYSLPHGVVKIYREAHDAFASSLNVVAGMGLRAVLEAVCLDREAKGATLKAKIENLKDPLCQPG